MDTPEDPKSFFKHVFNFDDESKSDILNILQYSLIAIIPIVILNKTMQKYIPEADTKKSSLELSAEVLIQIIVMFIGLMFIHRIITFFPTYSGAKYADFNMVYIILAILMITLSLQTKLGEKVSILTDRVHELWNGPPPKKGKNNGNGDVQVRQPLSQGPPTMSSTSAGTAISSLPSFDVTQPQQPNYDNMYTRDNNPLIGAATPGMEGMDMMSEPLAANAVLGGGAFGSW